MPETAVVDADPRAEACTALEKAFARRDWPGLYAAAEALSRSSFDMGRKKGAKWIPMNPAEEPAPEAAPNEAPKEWSVGELDASLVRFKRDAKVFTVVRGPDAGNLGGIVAFCDNGENAALIQRALAAYKGE